jgi:CBS domain-containing protein
VRDRRRNGAQQPLTPDEPLHEIVERFATERTDSLPVTDAVGSLTGIIAASDVERAISHGSGTTARGAPLTRDVPRLGACDSLEDAVQALASTGDEGVPVIDEDNQLVGWITHRHVLRTYLKRFGDPETALKPAWPPPPPPTPTTTSPTPTERPRR